MGVFGSFIFGIVGGMWIGLFVFIGFYIFGKEKPMWKIYYQCPICKKGMLSLKSNIYDVNGKKRYFCEHCGHNNMCEYHFDRKPGRQLDNGTFEWREWNE